jgi:hypothetical protein
LFELHGAEIATVELYADFDVRLARNKTENRLLHKPTKRDLQKSEEIFLTLESNHRFSTEEGEVPFKNFLRIDNTHLSPEEAAGMIKDYFKL